VSSAVVSLSVLDTGKRVAFSPRRLLVAGAHPPYRELPLELVTFGSIAHAPAEPVTGVAAVLLWTATDAYVGVGGESAASDRAGAPAVASTEVRRLDAVRSAWHGLRLRCSADGVLYQEAALAELLTLDDLMDGCRRSLGDDRDGAVVFVGSVPTLGGARRFARAYTCELGTQDGEVLVRHGFVLRDRPRVGQLTSAEAVA
jgi:hypothetical protein